jgi:hypothetical protein
MSTDVDLGYAEPLETKTVEWLASEVRLQHNRRDYQRRLDQEGRAKDHDWDLACRLTGRALLARGKNLTKAQTADLARILSRPEASALSAWAKALTEEN